MNWLKTTSLLQKHLQAFILGLLTVTTFAPFEFYWLGFPLLALLLQIWLPLSVRQAAINGFAFGFGLMSAGVFWLHVSISQFGNIPLLLAMLLALIFAAVVALYYSLLAATAAWLHRRWHLTKTVMLLMVYPALWVLLEWLRSELFTGFPWLSLGYAHTGSLLGQLSTLGGVFLVSGAVLLLSGGLLLLVTANRQHRRQALLVMTLVITVAGVVGHVRWTKASGEPLRVAIVQGNIEQSIKWQPDQLKPTLDLYRQLSFAVKSDVVIWPETALPAFLHYVDEPFLQPLAAKLRSYQRELVLGIPVWSEPQKIYFNSMLSIGSVNDRYDKRHLVPFGEYMPFVDWIGPLLKWMQVPMSNFRAGQAGLPLLKVGQYHAGVSICYEDAFGDLSIESLPQADYLLNISNDAWFGDSLAPHQHLQIARMRAVESARYLVRATNTGISAIVTPAGVLQRVSDQHKTMVIDGDIEPLQGMTLYSRLGDLPVLLMACIVLLLTGLSGRRFAQF